MPAKINPHERTPPPAGCPTTPSVLVRKMQLFWEYAVATPGIVGINPWHWGDRAWMDPASAMQRGAVSLLGGGPGAQGSLAQWVAWIGANVTANTPPPGPSPCTVVERGPGGCGRSPYLDPVTGVPTGGAPALRASFAQCSAACLRLAACFKFQRQESTGNCYFSGNVSQAGVEPNGAAGWRCGFKECTA